MITDDQILDRIANGESLRGIAQKEGFSESTKRYQLTENEALFARYTRAREAQAHHYAERIADMADEGGDPAQQRVKMDALKWTAARILPKVYSDKHTIDHTSSDGTMTPPNDVEAAARISAILAEAARKRAEEPTDEEH